MAIEIEKKYRLTKSQRKRIEQRMRQMSPAPSELEHEENTIYSGGLLDRPGSALRLRRVNGRALLTFKQRRPSKSAIKYQEEHEVAVADADAMAAIIDRLNFRPGVIYEKRRTRWQVGKAKVVIDELPFGLFMEIEASVKEIKRVEKLLGVETLPAVRETYPSLTRQLGKKTKRGVIEARFAKSTRPTTTPARKK
ncbi:MAG TPA: class IV adenylate cyclase [Pyrinomonadaceae bacterium]|jgi:predicted adenylyl cyclase CyaB|nr:class IV adenylate cyclase [Pyrinomonadaceae bacterium]